MNRIMNILENVIDKRVRSTTFLYKKLIQIYAQKVNNGANIFYKTDNREVQENNRKLCMALINMEKAYQCCQKYLEMSIIEERVLKVVCECN